MTGWRSIFMALGGLVALAMGLIAWQAPGWKKDPGPAEPSDLADLGYTRIWQSQQFRALVPIGFFNYGGLVAMQTLWTGPWLVKVSGYTPAQAAMGLFWINIAMLLAFLAWGSANPWLARRGHTTQKMIAYGAPLSLGIFAIILISGSAITTGATALWTLFFVTGTVGAQAQPAVGMAFKAELAGRALSAFNLVIFLGVFAVQWGVGLLVDGLRGLGLAEVAAFQGAMAVYGLCCIAAYLYFLAAKKP
jgi:hypothetical protein